MGAYVLKGLDDPLNSRWVPGFAIVGAIALIFGAHMTLTWPVIGPYNSAFGEMTVLYGGIFLGAALAIAQGWSLVSVATYAFFAGVAAILLGVRMIDLRLTQAPMSTGVGFILSGIAGVLAAPTLVWLRGNRPWRMVAAFVLAAAAAIWALVGYGAYWGHMESFGKWTPVAMRVIGNMPQ